MSLTRKILFGVAAAAGVGVLVVAVTGVGKQTLNTAKLELVSEAVAHGGGHWRGRGKGSFGKGMPAFCGSKRDEKLEDAIGFVEAFFSFSDAQRDAWDGLADSLRASSAEVGRQCEAYKADGRPETAPDKLAFVETMLTAGLGIVQNVRPSFDAFYGTLEPDQKAALDRLADRRRHR